MVHLKKIISLFVVTMIFCPIGFAASVTPQFQNEEVKNHCFILFKFQKVKEALIKGETALTKEQYEEASIVFDKGINVLGEAYRLSNTIDDSGMKLTLSNIEAKNGNHQVAANLKKGVLESRLKNFEKKHQACFK